MIGATGVIFHPGSAGQSPYKEALAKVVSSLQSVLDGYSGKCKLLLEVCAGQGETIGDRFSEFADIIDALRQINGWAFAGTLATCTALDMISPRRADCATPWLNSQN